MTDFLTPTGPKSLAIHQATPIPEELLWLANFGSERTRATYYGGRTRLLHRRRHLGYARSA